MGFSGFLSHLTAHCLFLFFWGGCNIYIESFQCSIINYWTLTDTTGSNTDNCDSTNDIKIQTKHTFYWQDKTKTVLRLNEDDSFKIEVCIFRLSVVRSVWFLCLSAAGLGEGPGAPVINGLYHLSNKGFISGDGVGSQACQMLQKKSCKSTPAVELNISYRTDLFCIQ